MTSSDRDAIRQRCERATKGPWTVVVREISSDPNEDHERFVQFGDPEEDSSLPKEADAEFIAHAREDIPTLLDALEQAEQQRDEWRVALEEIMAQARANTAATGATPEDPR